MKYQVTFAGLIASFTLFSQTQFDSKTLSIGQNYPNQAFYSLENGEVANEDNINWDLAFSATGLNSTFRINHAAGAKVWLYPNGGFDQWNSMDTNGLSSWPELINSTESWEMGALSQPADPTDQFDLGWGTYDIITHQVTGDRVFILQTRNGEYKKLFVESLASGTYHVKTANLDGSREENHDFVKGDFANRNFGYFDFDSGNTLDREPARSDWDLLFTKYGEEIQMGPGNTVVYGVSGVLANTDVETMKLYPLDDVYTVQDTFSGTFDASISAIGRSWKSFDRINMAWNIEDSTAFLVKTKDNAVWQVVFTGFTSDGTYSFDQKKLSEGTTSVNEKVAGRVLNVFPNPANDLVQVALDLPQNQRVDFKLYSLQGQLVQQHTETVGGFTTTSINVNSVPTGIYLLNIEGEHFSVTQRIVKQ